MSMILCQSFIIMLLYDYIFDMIQPVFGGTVGIQLIAEEDPRKKYLLAASNNTNITAPIRDVDLSYCSVKTGVNDLLDYMAISVSLIIPFVIGPLIVGVFQVS